MDAKRPSRRDPETRAALRAISRCRRGWKVTEEQMASLPAIKTVVVGHKKCVRCGGTGVYSAHHGGCFSCGGSAKFPGTGRVAITKSEGDADERQRLHHEMRLGNIKAAAANVKRITAEYTGPDGSKVAARADEALEDLRLRWRQFA